MIFSSITLVCIAVLRAEWQHPPNPAIALTTIQVEAIQPDWVWEGEPTAVIISGRFLTPPGYALLSSNVQIASPSGVASIIHGSSHGSSSVSVTIPATSESGLHCFKVSITSGTLQSANMYTIKASETLCFVSVPVISSLVSTGVVFGPPSGGTEVTFRFDMASRQSVVLLDCVFDSTRVPVTYTFPANPTDPISGSCVSPMATSNSYVCIQLAPRNTTTAVYPRVQNGDVSNCVPGQSFKYSFYSQMPILDAIVPNVGKHTGGYAVDVSGINFPADRATGLIKCRFGSNGIVSATRISANVVRCDSVPTAAATGESVPANRVFVVPVSLSFNDGFDFSIKTVSFRYVPISSISTLSPTVGPFSGGSKVRLTVSYSNPAATGLPSGGPSGICIITPSSGVKVYVTEDSVSTDFSSIVVTMPSVRTASAIGTDPAAPHTVQIALVQAPSGCGDEGNRVDFTYRKDWTATEVSTGLITGGSIMRLGVAGSEFFASQFTACRATVVWPATSELAQEASASQTECHVDGSFTVTGATTGDCDISLHSEFYDCSYDLAAQVMESKPSEEQLWEAMNVKLGVSMNGADFTTVTQTERGVTQEASVRVIRLPVIESISPEFGFDYGGYIVEVQLRTGTSWYTESCVFYNSLTGTSVEVAASPFSLKTVGCDAPKWMLLVAASTEDLEVKLKIRGSLYTAPIAFTMRRSPLVTGIDPLEGTVGGATLVTVYGSGFSQFATDVSSQRTELACVFGSTLIVPATAVSDTEIECFSPVVALPTSVPVDISLSWLSGSSNRRLTRMSLFQSLFTVNAKKISVLAIAPLSGPKLGGTTVYFSLDEPVSNNGLIRCQFGLVFAEAHWNGPKAISCTTPSVGTPGQVALLLSLDAQTTVDFNFHANIGNVTSGAVGSSYFLYYQPPVVAKTVPAFGLATGGTSVAIQGAHFLDLPGLSCKFGDAIVPVVKFVSSHIVVCVTESAALGNVSVSVGNNGVDFLDSSTSGIFTFTEAQPEISISPYLGPITGGTAVRITGSNGPLSTGTERPRCAFGTYTVQGTVKNAITGEVECISPAVPAAGIKTISIFLNGQEAAYANQQFLYHDLTTIDTIDPPLGPQGIPNMITITGANFINSEYLTVRFGTKTVGYKDVVGLWVSATELRASSPSVSPSSSILRMPVMVSNNGVDFVPASIDSWDPDDDSLDQLGVIRYYTFHVPVVLKTVYPQTANIHGGGYVSVYGGPFVNTGQMTCGFDWIRTDLTVAVSVFVNPSHILCPVPDMWASGSASSLVRSVKLQIALQGTQWSDSYLDFYFITSAPFGFYVPHLDPSTFAAQLLPCSPGYQCESSGLSAQIQCPPGTYQPFSQQLQCLPCPTGYFCPHARMEKPALCPAGWVCDEEGLVAPYKLCPPGYVCLQGTATSDPVPVSEPFVSLAPADFYSGVNAPYRCLAGMYCKEGVGSFVSIPGNISTPQPCLQGTYCRPGSSGPFGAGAAPLGRYSPTPRHPGIVCPPRFSCGPVTGNVEPMPCQPGTYNGLPGQHNCTLAHEGSIAPSAMMERPLESQCGFVAGRKGISALSEWDMCPPTMVCGFGVATDSEPKICFPITTTNETLIASQCQSKIGQHYIPALVYSGSQRVDDSIGNCCWTNDLVVKFANRVERIFQSIPIGGNLEERCARRFRQKIQALHKQRLQTDTNGFDGRMLLESVTKQSLLSTFGVNIARVRDRIVLELERFFSFKSPDPCEPGTFCNRGTCAGFATLINTAAAR